MNKIEELKAWNKFHADGMDKFSEKIDRLMFNITVNCNKSDICDDINDLEDTAHQTQCMVDDLIKEINRYVGYAKLISSNQKEMAIVNGVEVELTSDLEKMPDDLSYEDHIVYADYLLRDSQIH